MRPGWMDRRYEYEGRSLAPCLNRLPDIVHGQADRHGSALPTRPMHQLCAELAGQNGIAGNTQYQPASSRNRSDLPAQRAAVGERQAVVTDNDSATARQPT